VFLSLCFEKWLTQTEVISNLLFLQREKENTALLLVVITGFTIKTAFQQATISSASQKNQNGENDGVISLNVGMEKMIFPSQILLMFAQSNSEKKISEKL
jgi:hypothetical protein